MTDPFDPGTLTYSPPRGRPRGPRPPRHVTGYFLRGPVPWVWLTAAAGLPGKALHVAMFIRFQAGLNDSLTVAISLSAVARAFRFDRSSASRALALLASARLVSIEQAPGRKHIVTILDVIDTA